MVADIFPESPILITLPRILKNEAETLAALCGAGVSVIHIRKPEASEPEIEELLKTLQALGADMSRLTIHYNEPLARKYGLGGVHLRIEELLAGAGEGLRRSCSAHGWTEAERAATDADYVFLSPLFDSISKPGYRSAIDPAEAAERLRRRKGRIVALGGIRPANIARVRRIGFDGAAVLGAAWSADEKAVNTERTLKNYHILNRKWKAAGGTLQLISDGDLSVAAQFLDAGGRWIQLRMKDASAEVIVCRGKEMLALCRKRRAVLVVNDAPQLAVAIGADGVHLGQADMPPIEARRIIGDGAVIGSTANTFEQIVARNDGETDYVGLGPFRFTTTKKNLSPVLGTEGYRTILGRMRTENIPLPVVAIGGIELPDIPQIMRTGVDGIALSGAIARADSPATTTANFLNAIRNA
ncbi:thiamine phosphate synthase [Alistipes sp. cv1]|uniref:thiamine phosphate synthase n=1 Tax=Alistipes sp. cv1 TaxID=1622071 RepID=UPI000C78412E|nr:thiamine phosphate synthase [Alistipes sp. cv1]